MKERIDNLQIIVSYGCGVRLLRILEVEMVQRVQVLVKVEQ